MKKKTVVIMCSLLFAGTVLSFAQERKGPDPSVSAYAHANENAKFKRSGDVFNNRANRRIRAKRLAGKEAAEARKKAEEARDKGEGQVKVKF